MISGRHLTQSGRPERGDRDRQRVVRVVLVRPSRAQHPDSGREGRGHVDDGLAGPDQLLRQQVAKPVGGLDRPRALPQRLGPVEQLGHLPATSPHLGSGKFNFGAVDDNRGVRRLVRVDADDHGHEVLPD